MERDASPLRRRCATDGPSLLCGCGVHALGRSVGRRREELERYAVWIAEGDSRAVVGILDSAVRDAQLVQARGPGLQLIAITAGEGNMIQPGTMLVEPVTCGL